jgi:hypothetical protein
MKGFQQLHHKGALTGASEGSVTGGLQGLQRAMKEWEGVKKSPVPLLFSSGSQTGVVLRQLLLIFGSRHELPQARARLERAVCGSKPSLSQPSRAGLSWLSKAEPALQHRPQHSPFPSNCP